ncbi:Hypothetical protein BN69_2725 [Methylocystis sp. SC2]|nr:Hypothetical protein BN69_2725 [Methylocystis sp. SC2]
MTEYRGNCPCGQVEVILCSELAPGDFRPRSDATTCRFCRAHDGVWISDPNGSIAFRADDRTSVTTFASGRVQFHFCAECGALAYALFDDPIQRVRVAVARIALFDAIVRQELPVAESRFECETLEAARRRRLLTWTPIRASARAKTPSLE